MKKRRFIEQDTQKRFIEACRIGDVNIVRQLLKDEDVDPGDTCLISAIQNNNIETVKVLLTDGRIDPSVFDDYAIKLASDLGFVEIVKVLLIDERVDPSTQGDHVLISAGSHQNKELITVLLEDERVDPSVIRYCNMTWIKEGDHTKIVRNFLNHKKINYFNYIYLFPSFVQQESQMNIVRFILLSYDKAITKLFYFHGMLSFSDIQMHMVVNSINWKWDHTNFKFYPNIVQDNILQFLLIAKRNEKHYVLYKDIRLLLIFYIIKSGMEEWLLEKKIKK